MENSNVISISKNRKIGKNKIKDHVHTVLQEISDNLDANIVSEIAIIWRKSTTEEKQEFQTTDYFWWSSKDKYTLIGVLEFIKSKILDYVKATDEETTL